MGPRREAAQGGPREEVAAWVGAHAGPVLRFTPHHTGPAGPRVWRADTEGGPLWLKAHPHARSWAQERGALAELAPQLAGQGFRVPALVASEARRRLLLCTHVAGVDARTLDRADRQAAFRQAGRLLARIHALPHVDRDPLPLDRALDARARALVRRARGQVPEALLDRVLEEVDGGRPLRGCVRVPCHRDFGPRNWRVDEEGSLGLIDFEHTRPDAWLVDLLPLEEEAFARWPETRAPFFEGRGRSLTAPERDALSRLGWLHALGTVVHALDKGDPAFEARGRRALSRLGWRTDDVRGSAG